MAIERFQNKDILVSSKVPVDSVQLHSLEDLSNVLSVKQQLQPSDFDTFCKMEAHIYSADKLVSSLGGMLQYELNQGDDPLETNLLIRPEMQVRSTSLDLSLIHI